MTQAVNLDAINAIAVTYCWMVHRFGNNALGCIVASLDRKRLGKGRCFGMETLRRGVFDKETRRKPLALAADAVDAVRYGI